MCEFVHAWGEDDLSPAPPRLVSGALRGCEVVAVSAGLYHSAVATASGDLFVMGTNASACLGLGPAEEAEEEEEPPEILDPNSANSADRPLRPPALAPHHDPFTPRLLRAFPAKVRIAQVSCGGSLLGAHTLALTHTGRVARLRPRPRPRRPRARPRRPLRHRARPHRLRRPPPRDFRLRRRGIQPLPQRRRRGLLLRVQSGRAPRLPCLLPRQRRHPHHHHQHRPHRRRRKRPVATQTSRTDGGRAGHQWLQGLAPQDPNYTKLSQQYLALRGPDKVKPVITAPEEPIRPGARDPRIELAKKS